MALSGVSGQGRRLARVDEVHSADEVVHVDQLSDAALDALQAGVNGDGTMLPGIDAGDVVVFTDYYRVEAA
jgi:hypothetical protein